MIRTRRGSLLIEMIASMTAGSAVLLLAIGLIHQSMSWSSRTQVRSDQHRTLEHLARQWRRDAHEASAIELRSENEIVFRGQAGAEVVYRISGTNLNRITRMTSTKDSDNAGPLPRESFSVDQQCSIRFEQLDAPKRARIQIRRSVPGIASDAVPGGDRDAVPGMDREKVELSVEGVVDRWASMGGRS